MSFVTPRSTHPRALFVVAAMTFWAAAAFPAPSRADISSFGSTLSVPATIDTAAGLSYVGQTFTQYGTGAQIHVAHDGADTALWNVIGSRGAAAPAPGQVLSVELEGCAQPAPGDSVPPLVDIHFQGLRPAGASVTVTVTTQAFQVPVCGANGASGSTVSTYAPTNFCVARGDYIDFNDEGGFNPSVYPSGVPYQVIGAVPGSLMNSFIRNNGTNNGATFAPGDTTVHDGFALNGGREVLLQAKLATGADATPLCGGSRGSKAVTPPPGMPGGAPAAVIHPQRDGVNHRRIVAVAYFCAQTASCTGTVALTSGAQALGSAHLHSPGRANAKARVRLSKAAVAAIRNHRRTMTATLTITLTGGARIAAPITLKI